VGSILERSATLIVRHFWLLTGTAFLFLLVPFAIGEYIIGQAMTQNVASTLLHSIQYPGTSSAPAFPFNMLLVRQVLLGELVIAVGALLMPFASSAIAVNVVGALGGAVPGFRNAIERTLARWPQIVALIVTWFFMGTGAAVVVFAVGGAIVGTIVGLYRSGVHSALVLSLFVTAALIAGIALLVLLALLGVAVTIASFSVVVERRGVAGALGSGFERVFTRAEWKRALGAVVISLLFVLVVQTGSYVLQFVAFMLPGSRGVAVLVVASLLNALALCVVVVVQTLPYAVFYSDRLARERAEPTV
jgi:hypothetical protein